MKLKPNKRHLIFVRCLLCMQKRSCCTKEKIPKCNSSIVISKPFIRTFSPLAEERICLQMPKYQKEELFLKSWVFRALRSSIQGAALKTRQLLKKLDQNFYTCDSPVLFILLYHPAHFLPPASSGTRSSFPAPPDSVRRSLPDAAGEYSSQWTGPAPFPC